MIMIRGVRRIFNIMVGATGAYINDAIKEINNYGEIHPNTKECMNDILIELEIAENLTEEEKEIKTDLILALRDLLDHDTKEKRKAFLESVKREYGTA